MTFLISDPELIQNRRISELPQSAIDFFGSEVCLFSGVDEMRDDARLRHHLCTEYVFDFVRRISLARPALRARRLATIWPDSSADASTALRVFQASRAEITMTALAKSPVTRSTSLVRYRMTGSFRHMLSDPRSPCLIKSI